MGRGPEDSPNWKNIAPETDTPVVLVCRACSEEIILWHCADFGCCWCASCGANSKPPNVTGDKA